MSVLREVTYQKEPFFNQQYGIQGGIKNMFSFEIIMSVRHVGELAEDQTELFLSE